MNETGQLSQKSPPVRRKQRKKTKIAFFVSLLFFGLAVATLLPWSASIPNHLGYYSVCSFAPISAGIMFVTGIGFISYDRRSRKVFAVAMILEAVLIGYSGIWAYTAKMPLSSLQVSMATNGTTEQGDPVFGDNSSEVRLNFTFYNPTDVDTPTLGMEEVQSFINGMKLIPGTYDYWGEIPEIIKAHGTADGWLFIIIRMKSTQIEGGEIGVVWSAVKQLDFNLTLTGLFVARTSRPTDMRYPLGLVIAAVPFKVSCTSP